MLIIHAGDSELVAVDCFECIDAQLDVREKLRHASHIKIVKMKQNFALDNELLKDSSCREFPNMLTKPEKAKNLLQKRLFAIETKKRFQLELNY